MTAYQLPPVFHNAQEIDWQWLTNLSVSGRALSGFTQRADFGGGSGLWVATLTGIAVRSTAEHRQWSAAKAIFDGGVQQLIVPGCEPHLVPWPLYNGKAVTDIDQVPHDDDTFFSDETGYSSSSVVVRAGAAASMGDTTLVMEVLRSGAFLGGEVFSIQHPTVGWRRYVIRGIQSVVGTMMTVTIRGPLWEDVAEGDDIEFDSPRCLMVLRSPEDMTGPTRLRKWITGGAVFIETPSAY